MIRLIFGLIATIAIIFALWYFTPLDLKEKGVDFLTENETVPKKIRETASGIFRTPAEQREKLITRLENRLGELKTLAEGNNLGPEKAEILIAEAETLIQKIRERNEEQPGLLNATVQKVLGLNSGEKKECKDK